MVVVNGNNDNDGGDRENVDLKKKETVYGLCTLFKVDTTCRLSMLFPNV